MKLRQLRNFVHCRAVGNFFEIASVLVGSWGIGPFSNDNAMDFIDELKSIDLANLAFERTREALRGALSDPDLVETGVAEVAIAAAALVALNIRKHGHASAETPHDWEFVDLPNAEEVREMSLAVLGMVEGVYSAWMDDCIDARIEAESREMIEEIRVLLTNNPA
ncbi:DUF4259 domain-containing protein [Kitasatospora purpeofusca]|uniref:DUF4259 domain-containing protein n=1 Tax=Kitasatospora purpeofusca TaxID=67352 RepID=UPI0030F330BA